MITESQVASIVGAHPRVEFLARRLNTLADVYVDQGSLRGVTALKTHEAIYKEFILDSLVGAMSLPTQGEVIDIGTGGGVPGLVLALARPDLRFVLTDSASKKTKWVSELVQRFELPNVEVVTQRLELLGRDERFRERFDAVTAKALASLNVLLEFALPLLKVEGRLLAYKGPALTEEITQAGFALRALSGRVHRCCCYTIEDKTFALCEVLKLSPTSDEYPRRDGIPQKKPL
mgnify:CR=1 FL=1